VAVDPIAEGQATTPASAATLHPVVAPSVAWSGTRPAAHGKFLYCAGEKLHVRGVTYGAFAPDADGREYRFHETIERDFERMAAAGFNAVRIPHTMPPVTLLDAAARHGLHVMVGLSAEQYVGHLADPRGAPDVEAIVREKVRSVAGISLPSA